MECSLGTAGHAMKAPLSSSSYEMTTEHARAQSEVTGALAGLCDEGRLCGPN